MHAGVYVDHTGVLSWGQRAWAGVLLHAPSALDGASALRAWDVRTGRARDRDPIELLVAHGRRVDDPPGVRTRVARGFADVALLGHLPPRVRLEAAVVRVASEQRRPDSAVAVLADAVQSRRTTVQRLRAAVVSRPRVPRRALMLEVLGEVEEGAMSALERRYLRDVERAHGLPRAARQIRRSDGGYDDVHYPAHGVRVELDGMVGHTDTVDRWADLERDAETARVGDIAVRAGWRHVLDPCRLASVIGAVLSARGWDGRATCPQCDRGGSSAAGAVDPPRSA